MTKNMPIWILFILLCAVSNNYAQDIGSVDVKHPVKLSGGVNLQLETYSATGIENRKKPFTWVLTGNPTIEIMGVQLPFFFLFSNYENHYFQPFNQFGISPSYKWAKLHLGYRNVEFSQFTLAGARMLGAGIELAPKGFRFGFMYGRLHRSTTIDSIQNANPLGFRTAANYTRMAYAVKVGVGNNENYFDVHFLKGWDVESSLSQNLRDSVAPEENKVVGLSWRKVMFKKLVWKTDIGGSIYTSDIHASPIKDSTYKEYLTPEVVKAFNLNSSSQYQWAAETRLGFHDTKFGADVVYRRVDPNYRSMGAYFFQADVEQFSVAPYARLDGGRLYINGNIGIQHDNLDGLKLATSNRIIGNANISYNPSAKFGVNFNYGNYGITQNPTRAFADSNLFKQVSQNFTLVPYVNLTNERIVQNFQAVGVYMLLSNKMKGINTNADQSTLVSTFSYSRTWLKNMVTANVSLNYNTTKLPEGDFDTYGIGVGYGMPVYHKKVTIHANVTYNTNAVNGKQNGHTVNADAGCSVPIDKHNSIDVQCTYLDNRSEDNNVIQSFSELTFRFGYGFRFR